MVDITSLPPVASADGGALPADVAQRRPIATLNQILKLANKLMAPFSTYLERQYAISLNEFRLLMLIGQRPMTASHELVEMTGVSAMSVSRAVAALKKHGRIDVLRDERNGRRKVLRLTEDGKGLYDRLRPSSDLVAEYLLSGLDVEEVADLEGLLAKLLRTVEATDAHGKSLFLEATRPEEKP